MDALLITLDAVNRMYLLSHEELSASIEKPASDLVCVRRGG